MTNWGRDAAVRAADTLLLTVPSQLGIDYNQAMLEKIAREIAPGIGWNPARQAEPLGWPGVPSGGPARARLPRQTPKTA